MARARPFESAGSLDRSRERIWWELADADWLEAFAAHPRIGDVDAIRPGSPRPPPGRAANRPVPIGATERRAQRACRAETVSTKQRFGFIFIVCATGKTADEMLELLHAAARQRHGNRDQGRGRRAAENHQDSPGKDRPMSPITSHVLDTALGKPAAGIVVVVESWTGRPTAGPSWHAGSPTATAGSHGSSRRSRALEPGLYRLRFFTAAYFSGHATIAAFYPEVNVTVQIDEPGQHYHIPFPCS